MTDLRPDVPVAVPLAGVVGVVAAAVLVPLNSTMIAVALPAIADDFDVSTAGVSTLVTLYLVVMLVGQPLAGRVADAVGTGRTVRVALAGLAACSLFAALATSFPFLVVARSLQAVCAAAVGPGVQSLLRSVGAPTQQGRLFGILGSALGVGAASGPVVGGALVQLFDWRSIFVVNVPIALLALAATHRSARHVQRTASDGAIDLPGPPDAPGDGRILNPVFTAGYAAQALTTQAQYALLLLVPIVLDARGWAAGSVGLVLSALTVGMIVTGPIGGRFGDSVGRRRPALVGTAVALVATVVVLVGGPGIRPLILTVALAAFGLGLGAMTPNAMSAALGSVPDRRTGSAAGVLTTSRYVGSITTAALVAAWVSDDGGGLRSVLTVSVVCMSAALIALTRLPGRAGTPVGAAAPARS